MLTLMARLMSISQGRQSSASAFAYQDAPMRQCQKALTRLTSMTHMAMGSPHIRMAVTQPNNHWNAAAWMKQFELPHHIHHQRYHA